MNPMKYHPYIYHPIISQSPWCAAVHRGSTRAGGSMAIPCCQWWRLRKVSRPKTSQARSKKSCDVRTQSIDMHRLWHRYRIILMMIYIYICMYTNIYIYMHIYIYVDVCRYLRPYLYRENRTGSYGVTKYGMILQICRGPSLDCGYYRQ